MGQTLCREYAQLSANGTGLRCTFVEWPFLRQLAEPSTDNWIPVYFSGGALICLLFLWFVSFCINYSDFTRSFVIGQLIPYTLTYLSRFSIDLYQRLSATRNIYIYVTTSPSTVLSQIYTVAYTASGLNLPLGTAIFLFSSISVASSRKKPGCAPVWIPYCLCLLLSLACGAAYNYLQFRSKTFLYDRETYDLFTFSYNVVVRVCILACLLLVFIILCALCCCSRPRLGQSREPSVSNARSRMLWAIPFVFVSLLPLTYGTTVTDLYYTISQAVFGTSVYGDRLFLVMHTFLLVDMLDPYLLTLSVLLFLPAYRSTIIGSQGYSSKEPLQVVKPASQVPQVKLPPSTAPLAPTPGPPAPTANNGTNQIAQNRQPAGQYDANLVTMLTTPSAMYGPVHSVPLPGSVPQQVCSCQSSAYMPSPIYQMVQQPVIASYQHPAICPHHQGNLLRFASQPNLHSTVSMPSLSVVHTSPGPLYLQA